MLNAFRFLESQNPYRSPWGYVSSIGISKNVTKDFSFLIKSVCLLLWSKALHVQYKACDKRRAIFIQLRTSPERAVFLIK